MLCNIDPPLSSPTFFYFSFDIKCLSSYILKTTSLLLEESRDLGRVRVDIIWAGEDGLIDDGSSELDIAGHMISMSSGINKPLPWWKRFFKSSEGMLFD